MASALSRLIAVVCIAFSVLVSGVMPWTDETSPLNVHHAVARTEVESSSAYDLTRLSLLGLSLIHI